jgi:murein DD-endopeptidase MepM/ murein hydrolase activator NlpD
VFGLPGPVRHAAFGAAGVAASLAGDAVFDPAALAAFWAAGLMLSVAAFIVRRSDASLAGRPGVAVARGTALGLAISVTALVCWLAGEMIGGGRWPAIAVAAARVAIGWALGSVVTALLRRRASRTGEALRWVVGAAAALGSGVAVGLFVFQTGPADAATYPPAAESPYRLPWPAGQTRLCVQGNRAVVSHRDWEEYAYDFVMPVGTVFCAARAGIVKWVEDEHVGNGPDAPGNEIVVLHEDGTSGVYLHLRRGGSLVRPGQRVSQGEPLGLSGNVGRSMLPHLHFHVEAHGRTIPITFHDVGRDGVPRMFLRYTSGNGTPE